MDSVPGPDAVTFGAGLLARARSCEVQGLVAAPPSALGKRGSRADPASRVGTGAPYSRAEATGCSFPSSRRGQQRALLLGRWRRSSALLALTAGCELGRLRRGPDGAKAVFSACE